MIPRRLKKSPAQHFRYAFRTNDIYEMPKTTEVEKKFREELELDYQKIKNKIQNFYQASFNVVKPEKSIRNDLFIASVGLFAYGQLNVAEDILDNIPEGKSSLNHLAGVLNELLPLPRDYNPRDNPNAIKEWLRVKRSRLKWDESLERYVLDNFRILSNLPTQVNFKNFTVREQQKLSENLILEILPDDGSNWYASFQSGYSEFSGVYQHPNRIDLIIISNGQGYIVNPESQQLLETFGGEITEAIELLDSYALLFQDLHGFMSYNETGFLWRNQELSWSSIRQLKVKRNLLIGEYKRSIETDWEPFWLNVKTGEIHLEQYDPLKDFRQSRQRNETPWWKIW